MARIVRGPVNVKFGDNQIDDIEEIEIEHEVDEEEYSTVQGKVRTVDGPYKVSATITLLASDIPTLAAFVPQYFVPNGGELSTGETVNHADGAIDIKAASCDENIVYENFDIESCGNPADVMRIVNARTRIEGVEIDDKVRKVMIKVIGESEGDQATIQFFRKGTVNVIS